MPSQKSTAGKKTIAPKRERGRLRVAAILDAGALLFTEKGYDAVTMTEVAARADTAIGSLYRFFPSKELLAEALMRRFAERMIAGLAAILAAAPGMKPPALADALVALWLELARDRTAAVVLVDVQPDADNRRALLRDLARRRLAAILAANRPLAKSKAAAMARVVLHLLKAVPGFAAEDAAGKTKSLVELRAALAAYLESRARP